MRVTRSVYLAILNTSVPRTWIDKCATLLTTGRIISDAALTYRGEAELLRSMTSQAQLEVSCL